MQWEHVSGFAQRRQHTHTNPHTRTHKSTHARTHTNRSSAWGEKTALTQDSTLRMVCGCLAKLIGSIVDPVRPAPNDPTPSIFSLSLSPFLSLCISLSQYAPPGSSLSRMDALLCCRDGSCALTYRRAGTEEDAATYGSVRNWRRDRAIETVMGLIHILYI